MQCREGPLDKASLHCLLSVTFCFNDRGNYNQYDACWHQMYDERASTFSSCLNSDLSSDLVTVKTSS